MKVRIADLNLEIQNKYAYLERLCKDYMSEFDAPDMVLSVSEDEIERENTEGKNFSKGYLEGLAIYRRLAEGLISYGGFLMHGVLMEAEGQGVLFCARSGVGKSTHAAMWLRYLGRERCKIVNGDKPLLRFIEGKLYAYGTPWCGKEGLQENRSIELKNIAFIERGEVNETFQISPDECFQALINQTHFPQDDLGKLAVLEMCGKVMENVRFFKIKCKPDIAAAEAAVKAML